MVIQLSLLIDVQLQLAPLFTLIELNPPPIGTNWLVGERVVGGFVAEIAAIVELSDRSGSVAEESTVTMFSIITLLGIEQATFVWICRFTDAPTSSEFIVNTALFPA